MIEMKNIVVEHIKDLLFYHECVIVPDFGGFICTKIPAVIDHKKNYFYPPSGHIYFNRHLINNDGLLLHSISLSTQYDYKKSKAVIESFIKEVYSDIDKTGKCIIETFGTFKYDDNKNIIFKPDKNFNPNLQSFGMISFNFPALYNKQEETLKEVRKKLKDKEHVRQLVRNKYAKRSLVALPIALLLTLIPYKTNIFEDNTSHSASVGFNVKNYFEETLDNPGKIDDAINFLVQKENALLYVEESKRDTETVNVNYDSSGIINLFDAIKFQPKIDTVDERSNTAKGINNFSFKKYQLIAASFTEDARAELFCNEMKSKGFNSVILPRTSGRLRISVNGFDNKQDALKELARLRDEAGLTVWVLTQ